MSIRERARRRLTATALCESLPVVLVFVLVAASIRALEWVLRGVGGRTSDVLGRGRRAEKKAAVSERSGDDDEGRPGWPCVDDVESALEDLRRRAA